MGIRNTSNIKLLRNASPTVKMEEDVPAVQETFVPVSFESLKNIQTKKSVLGKFLSDVEIKKAINDGDHETISVPRKYWTVLEEFFDKNNLIRPDYDAWKEKGDGYASAYQSYGTLYTSETAFDLGKGKQLLFVAQWLDKSASITPEKWAEFKKGRPGVKRLTEAFIRIIDAKTGRAEGDFYINNSMGYPCSDKDGFHLSLSPDTKSRPADLKSASKFREKAEVGQLALAKFLNMIMSEEEIDLSNLPRHQDTEFLLKRF